MKQEIKHRGIFEKVPGSDEWWIRYAHATGRIRREKVGTQEEAEARLKLRKEEAKLGAQPIPSRHVRSKRISRPRSGKAGRGTVTVLFSRSLIAWRSVLAG
jgi:hypothetical protein